MKLSLAPSWERATPESRIVSIEAMQRIMDLVLCARQPGIILQQRRPQPILLQAALSNGQHFAEPANRHCHPAAIGLHISRGSEIASMVRIATAAALISALATAPAAAEA